MRFTFRVICGDRGTVEREINKLGQDGWLLIGPPAFAGFRERGDPSYPLNQTRVSFYVATMQRMESCD